MARAAASDKAFDNDELSEFREAEERARSLREEALAREQNRVRAVMAALNATPEELLGLPPRKRRRKTPNEIA